MKKTLFVTECGGMNLPDLDVFDLAKLEIHDCIGCWSCWWKTPGRCVFKELDQFYHRYITANRVVFFAKVSQGFVSGGLKTLFDRMIPLFLPYSDFKTGESMHLPRYGRYPDIEFYYDGEFDDQLDQKIFTDYIHRVFYQFHSKNSVVKPIAEWGTS